MIPSINDLLKPRPRRYRNIAKHLSPYVLSAEDNETIISYEDIFHDLSTHKGTDRFLGTFTQKGIEFVLNKFGVFHQMDRAGLSNPDCSVNTDDPFLHRISLTHTIDGETHLTGELSMRKTSMDFPNIPESYTLLLVEWFMLQHPLKSFSKKRPQLPGQNHPGLGISELIFELFYWTARRLKIDGIVLVPNYLHTGIFYGRQFLFIDPKRQGELYGIDWVKNHRKSINQLSWACAEGQLINLKKNVRYQWIPAPMALPVSRKLKDYFHDKDYVHTVRRVKSEFRIKVNPGYSKKYLENWSAQ